MSPTRSGSGRPTIAQIAEVAGVSKGSVSLALNGKPGLSETTRQRIVDVADEFGWRPNSAARALSVASVGACGLVIARPAHMLAAELFFIELISGIEAELAEQSVALVLQVVHDVEAEVAAHRRWWAERRVDGVFVLDLQVDDPRVQALSELGMPAVALVPSPGHGGPVPAIWNDVTVSVVEVVRYLAALGHRRLARVGGRPGLLHVEARTATFLETATQLGLTMTVKTTDFSGEEGARVTRSLLLGPERPTAIVYDNDVMAVAGLSVAHELGIAVPQELSIVAWDDSPLCQLMHPPLSAVSRDLPAYGAHAAAMLLAAIRDGHVEDREEPPGHLTPRGSTARARDLEPDRRPPKKVAKTGTSRDGSTSGLPARRSARGASKRPKAEEAVKPPSRRRRAG